MDYNKEYLEAKLEDVFLMYQEKYRNEDMDEKQIRCKVYRDFLDSM